MIALAITGYRSRHDTRPLPAIVMWDSLAARLATPRVASCTVASCIGRDCPFKCGTLWSPASIAPGKTRRNEWVTVLSALVLDGDHIASNGELSAIVECVTPFRRIVHATHSDRPGDRCVRIVIPLSRPATRDEAPAVWSSAVELLGIPADKTCKDPSRAYYAPSRPRDADYYYARGDGAAIDMDELLANVSLSSTQRPSTLAESSSTTPDEVRVRRARAYVAEMPPAIQGDRGSAALFAAVSRVMHGFDLDDATTHSIIAELYNPRCKPPWSHNEIGHKIAEARSKVHDRNKWRVDARASWIDEATYSGREPTPTDLRGDR